MSKKAKASDTPALKYEVKLNKPRKIAILGTASTSLCDAPYDNPEWKIWDMSANFIHGKRYNLWFELHPYQTLEAASAHPDYLKFLKNAGPALVAGHPDEEHWPLANGFPIVSIVDRYGDYFTSSAALMIAYAVMLHEDDIAAGGMGVGEIGLWGVHMIADGEYQHQKACCEYWIGFARGKGIKVTVAPQSPLCRGVAIYAFDNIGISREFTERITELRSIVPDKRRKLLEAEQALRQAQKEVHEVEAAERVIKEIAHCWNL